MRSHFPPVPPSAAAERRQIAPRLSGAPVSAQTVSPARVDGEVLDLLARELGRGVDGAAVERRDETSLEADPEPAVAGDRDGRVPRPLVAERPLADPSPGLAGIARDEDAERRAQEERRPVAAGDALDRLRLRESAVRLRGAGATNEGERDERREPSERRRRREVRDATRDLRSDPSCTPFLYLALAALGAARARRFGRGVLGMLQEAGLGRLFGRCGDRRHDARHGDRDRAGARRLHHEQRFRLDQRHRPRRRCGGERPRRSRSGCARGAAPSRDRFGVEERVRRARVPSRGQEGGQEGPAREPRQRRRPRQARAARPGDARGARVTRRRREPRRRRAHSRSGARARHPLRHEARDGRRGAWRREPVDDVRASRRVRCEGHEARR